jgi:hypothetical protein
VQIAAQEHHNRNDDDAEDQPNARHDIHGRLQRARTRPAILDGGAAHPQAAQSKPYGCAIKDA